MAVWAYVALAAAQAPMPTVVQVFDGDTVALNTGERVRLLDINTPEGPHHGAPAEPLADAARTHLAALVLDKPVRLELGKTRRDRYGRLLAHIYLQDGTWLNGRMVEDGLAVAYTFADNHLYARRVLLLEQQAREAKRGLWALPRWRVKDAETCCAPDEMGLFQVVEGTVTGSGGDKNFIYLNFGPDYRTDFTIRIARKDLKHFKEWGIKKPDDFYKGKSVRVHGVVQPVYGAMVVVSHPAQVEVVE
ncbi:MAG: thermonuclease family protein [Pseudomonadaceae bacterium]|nr:thermonuclease family protein [Pseudomonadaceae bacterium]